MRLWSGAASPFKGSTGSLYTNNMSSHNSSKVTSTSNSHDPIPMPGNMEESVDSGRPIYDDDTENMTMESGGGLYMEGAMNLVIEPDDEYDSILLFNRQPNSDENIHKGVGLDDDNMDGEFSGIPALALQSITSDCLPPSYHSLQDDGKEEQRYDPISLMEPVLYDSQQQQQQKQILTLSQSNQLQPPPQQLHNYSISMANGSTTSDPFIYSCTSWQNPPASGSTNTDASLSASTTGEPLFLSSLQPPPPPPPQQQQQQQPRYIDDTIIRSNLFVSGLHPSVTDAKLHELFYPYGTIESSKVMLDIHTGKSRGIAFVKFDNVKSAEQAIVALNNNVHLGETIAVRVAKPHAAYRPCSPTNKTFVRNVPLTVRKSDLTTHFGRYGEVIDVSIHSDTAQRVTNKKRNVVFVAYTTKEAAARAAQETHTTMPFPDCDGVPLLAKVAEDSAHRIERLARRGAVRGGKSGLLPIDDSCGAMANSQHISHGGMSHHAGNHHHSIHGVYRAMDHLASASMSSLYPFPPITTPTTAATTLCVSSILTDPYGPYAAPPTAAFYATPFISVHHGFNNGNDSTTSAVNNKNTTTTTNNNNNNTNSPNNVGDPGNGNDNDDGNNIGGGGGNGFGPILFLGPETTPPPPPPPMYTAFDGGLQSSAPHVGGRGSRFSHHNHNNNNANANKSTDHVPSLMACPTRHTDMMTPTPAVMYYMPNGQMALGPPRYA